MGKEIRDDGPLLSIPTHNKSTPKFVHRHGEYDQIVCEQCERSFGHVDDYFADFSRARDSGKLVSKGEARAYVYEGWDQASIQRFFLTCLYRSHLSSRKGYGDVELGSHADRLKLALIANNKALVPNFEVMLLRETHPLSCAITFPVRMKIDGINLYRMGVPGFGAIVRVDQQPAPRNISAFSLGAWPEIWALEIYQVHPKLLAAMADAEVLHGDRISRMIAPRSRRTT